MFYSASKNTWFAPECKADYEAAGSWPEDAVEYPREVFDEVVSHRPEDKIMVPDEAGFPVLRDPTPPSAEQVQAQINADARAYLASTDWYVIRQQETGQAAPDDVITERAAARARVVE